VVIALLAAVVGCRPQQPFYFGEDRDMSHYVGVATEIEYPDVETDRLEEVNVTKAPLSLLNPDPSQIWELTLEDAIRYTMVNSKVLRNLGGIVFGAGGSQGEPTSLTSQPDLAASVYTPALVESDPRFGVEGALAAFDAQFTTSMFWEKNVTPQNTSGLVESFRPNPLRQDLATFQAQLQKTSATGATFTMTHSVNYELNNVSSGTLSSSQRWPAAYNVNMTAQIRQPILQGAGVMFNRIAGPGATPGVYNGVMIARIRTDIALADFEGNVRNVVRDVERAYWELYYAYRRLDAVLAGRDAALQTWRQVHAKFVVGARGGGAQDEAQARQQYFTFRSAVEQALDNLYRTENALRYMIGLAPNDGRLIRPADEPTTAKVQFVWNDALGEALVRAVELRQQKWRIKQRELELIASKNFLLPRLDGVASYSWLGLGDRLLGKENQLSSLGPGDPGVPFSAYESLTGGDYQGWQMGVQLQLPVGFRREMAGVRNAQLNLARERAILQEQELELTHQLTSVFRDLDDFYVLAQTNFNRRIAAENEVKAVRAAYETGAATLDLLLTAQQRLAEAEDAYFRALTDYSEAIMNVHYRKGSLLEYNGVCLTEGPWPGKAYFDAQRRARARDAGIYLDYGFTKPRVMSRGPIEQAPSQGMSLGDAPLPGALSPLPDPLSDPGVGPAPAPALEEIPAPNPEGKKQLPPAPTTIPEPGDDSAPSLSGPKTGDVSLVPMRPMPRKNASAQKYNLKVLNLDILAGDPLPTQSRPTFKDEPSPVQAVSYQEDVPPTSKMQNARPAAWKSTQRASTTDEPVTSPSPAQVDRSSAGWKRVQR
jgi:outer membrane protein TolC